MSRVATPPNSTDPGARPTKIECLCCSDGTWQCQHLKNLNLSARRHWCQSQQIMEISLSTQESLKTRFHQLEKNKPCPEGPNRQLSSKHLKLKLSIMYTYQFECIMFPIMTPYWYFPLFHSHYWKVNGWVMQSCVDTVLHLQKIQGVRGFAKMHKDWTRTYGIM